MSQVISGSATVLADTVGAVRILTLNRPEKLNAANLELQQTLLSHLEAVAADPEIRALVLTGAGRAFSAGGDRSLLEEIAAGGLKQHDELGRVHIETIRVLLTLKIPAIAAVNGAAVGYAAGLVALCDLVVMGEDAFLCDPHVTFGLAANSATQLVWPRLTSYGLAKEILMTGRKVRAQEAVEIGLANRRCTAGQERAVALEIAQAFCDMPPSGVAETKHAFNRFLIEDAIRLGYLKPDDLI